MNTMASQITGLTIVYSTVYSGANQRKHQSFVSLAFVKGIHRWHLNSPHKGQVMRKMLPFGDVIIGWDESLNFVLGTVAAVVLRVLQCYIEPKVYTQKVTDAFTIRIEIMRTQRNGDKTSMTNGRFLTNQ